MNTTWYLDMSWLRTRQIKSFLLLGSVIFWLLWGSYACSPVRLVQCFEDTDCSVQKQCLEGRCSSKDQTHISSKEPKPPKRVQCTEHRIWRHAASQNNVSVALSSVLPVMITLNQGGELLLRDVHSGRIVDRRAFPSGSFHAHRQVLAAHPTRPGVLFTSSSFYVHGVRYIEFEATSDPDRPYRFKKEVKDISLGRRVDFMVFSPTGRFLVFTNKDAAHKSVYMTYNLFDESVHIERIHIGSRPMFNIVISADETWIVGADEGSVYAWKREKKPDGTFDTKQIYLWSDMQLYTSRNLHLHPDQSMLAVTSGQKIHILSFPNLKNVHTVEAGPSKERLNGDSKWNFVSFSKDGKQLFARRWSTSFAGIHRWNVPKALSASWKPSTYVQLSKESHLPFQITHFDATKLHLYGMFEIRTPQGGASIHSFLRWDLTTTQPRAIQLNHRLIQRIMHPTMPIMIAHYVDAISKEDRLMWLHLETGKKKTLLREAWSTTYIRSMTFSPDGSFLLLTRDDVQTSKDITYHVELWQLKAPDTPHVTVKRVRRKSFASLLHSSHSYPEYKPVFWKKHNKLLIPLYKARPRSEPSILVLDWSADTQGIPTLDLLQRISMHPTYGIGRHLEGVKAPIHLSSRNFTISPDGMWLAGGVEHIKEANRYIFHHWKLVLSDEGKVQLNPALSAEQRPVLSGFFRSIRWSPFADWLVFDFPDSLGRLTLKDAQYVSSFFEASQTYGERQSLGAQHFHPSGTWFINTIHDPTGIAQLKLWSVREKTSYRSFVGGRIGKGVRLFFQRRTVGKTPSSRLIFSSDLDTYTWHCN